MDLPTAPSDAEAPPVAAAVVKPAAAPAPLEPADPTSGDELELAPPPPPSKRSGPRSAPPAVATAEAPGPARAAFASDPQGAVSLEIGAGALERRGRANLPVSAVPSPMFVPRTLPDSEPPHPRSLRGAVQLMSAGAAVALVFVIGGQLAEPVRELGQAPKLVGVGIFVVGLLLLFWRMLER